MAPFLKIYMFVYDPFDLQIISLSQIHTYFQYRFYIFIFKNKLISIIAIFISKLYTHFQKKYRIYQINVNYFLIIKTINTLLLIYKNKSHYSLKIYFYHLSFHFYSLLNMIIVQVNENSSNI